jgi:alpha-beta hydrolase superfamily lysophospholipase
VLNALSISLGWIYMLVPLVAMAATTRRAWESRSKSDVCPLLGTFISAAIIGFGINFAYAQAAAAKWMWGQVFLTIWFVAAVLLVLKAFDAAVKKGATSIAGKRRKLATILRIVVLFIVGMPYVMAIGMAYRTKVRGPDPREQLGIAFQDVSFGDTRLAGWWIEPKSGAGKDTVLICHGLGASKSNFLPMAEPVLRAGSNVLIFDFRAHGASAGQVTTFGDTERQDVLAAVAWLRKERPNQSQRVMGLGASMGAAALIAAAADDSEQGRAIDAVAVYGTYDDLGALTRSVCDRHFPRPLNWLGRYVAVPLAGLHAGTNLYGFSPADLLHRLPPRPILIIHGTSDEIIATEHGHRLFERAGEPKQSLWIDGDHNSVLNDPNAARTVTKLFSESARFEGKTE